MKKKLIVIIFNLLLVGKLFSQEFFYDDYTKQVFYQGKEFNYSWFKEYIKNNELIFFYSPIHDRKTDKYYLFTNDYEFMKFQIYLVSGNELSKEKAFEFSIEKDAGLCFIDDSKALLWAHKENVDYYVVDLKTNEVKEIYLEKMDNHYFRNVDFKNNKIFFNDCYYDLEEDRIKYYPVQLERICVDKDGDRIVGIDKNFYITIVDLKTNSIKRTKQKRKYKYFNETTNVGTFYLNGNDLFFSKRKYSFAYLFSFLGGKPKERRQWYKMDITTGKVKEIQQPTKYVDML